MSASTDNCKNIIATFNSATLLKKPPERRELRQGHNRRKTATQSLRSYGAMRGIAGLPAKLFCERAVILSFLLHSL